MVDQPDMPQGGRAMSVLSACHQARRCWGIASVLILAGCEMSDEDRLLECLKSANNEKVAMICRHVYEKKDEKPNPPAPQPIPKPEPLDVDALELKWVQPYLGSRLDDGSPVQSCLHAFDVFWEKKNQAPLPPPTDAFEEILYSAGEVDLHRLACYPDNELLDSCTYCDEYRQQEERETQLNAEKKARIEALRAAASS